MRIPRITRYLAENLKGNLRRQLAENSSTERAWGTLSARRARAYR
jgi:hypothetical protein